MHRAWLMGEAERLWTFAEASMHPGGGFGWLDDDGRLDRDRPVETWITCRMTHVFALAHLAGRPGAGRFVDHGLTHLAGRARDSLHDGWYASTNANGPVVDEKRAYDHAFVLLAASSAATAGRPGAEDLLASASSVVDRRFWHDEEGMSVDVWDRAFNELEAYRGINANMHAVESYLAVADYTGETRWRERALRIADRALNEWARQSDWRIPEHFTATWEPIPDYHIDEPAHPFRPYGATVGHALEWSRLALQLEGALGAEAPPWLRECAQSLFRSAVEDGWAADGADGLLYTTSWDGAPVVRDRMHWVVCEAISAAATLHRVTGEDRYEHWYRTWWDHAATYFVDGRKGSWRHQLDEQNRPTDTVWAGKPDVYHAVQATLLPGLPLAGSIASALCRSQETTACRTLLRS